MARPNRGYAYDEWRIHVRRDSGPGWLWIALGPEALAGRANSRSAALTDARRKIEIAKKWRALRERS